MGSIIYQQFHGRMTKINEPRIPGNANFVIKWRGMDWSGYRTLAECEAQFHELEGRKDAQQDQFQVWET